MFEQDQVITQVVLRNANNAHIVKCEKNIVHETRGEAILFKLNVPGEISHVVEVPKADGTERIAHKAISLAPGNYISTVQVEFNPLDKSLMRAAD